MALVWRPLDGATIDTTITVAGSSWAREDIDRTWAAAGWPLPDRGSVASAVFDELNYTLDGENYLIRLGMRFDPDTIVSIHTEFATFLDEPDTDDPDVRDLVSPHTLGPGWFTDASAGRPAFDAQWLDAFTRLSARLGIPDSAGAHSAEWEHAAWRHAGTLIVLAQGEDIDSYGAADSAALWAVPHPSNQDIPGGKDRYLLLYGDG